MKTTVEVPLVDLEFALGFTCHGHKNRTDQAMDLANAREKIRAVVRAAQAPAEGWERDMDYRPEELGDPESEPFRADKPGLGSRWQHHNGARYTVKGFTNLASANEKYPPTVVYEGDNGLVWSRPLSDWARSMTPVKTGGQA